MATFSISHNTVMNHEGGYANHPQDRGGETYKGIARKRHPNWEGWKLLDQKKREHNFPNNLPEFSALQKLVLAFYKVEFWDALSLDLVQNQNIATELYDTAVNMGKPIAANFLQTALNVSNRDARDYPDLNKDGKIGPVTIAVLNSHKRPNDLLKVLNCLQGARYIEIMERNPDQEIFFRSWFSRVELPASI